MAETPGCAKSDDERGRALPMAMSATQALIGGVEEIGLCGSRMARMVREGAYTPVARPDGYAIGGSKQLALVDAAQRIGDRERIVHSAKRVDKGIEADFGHTAANVVGKTAADDQLWPTKRDAGTAGTGKNRSGPLELGHEV